MFMYVYSSDLKLSRKFQVITTNLMNLYLFCSPYVRLGHRFIILFILFKFSLFCSKDFIFERLSA